VTTLVVDEANLLDKADYRMCGEIVRHVKALWGTRGGGSNFNWCSCRRPLMAVVEFAEGWGEDDGFYSCPGQ
jgi:hypothetical protein